MPEIREVWLVRHGVTTSNRDRIVQGHVDIPLSAEGELQARALGNSLARRGIRFDVALASDLSRARRTAELVLDAAAPERSLDGLDPAWREAHYGDFEGRPGAELQAFRDRPHDDPAGAQPPGGGESLRDLQTRVVAALEDWTSRPAAGPRLLAVTHGGPIGALVCHALGLPPDPAHWRRFRRDNTGVTILRRRSRAPQTWQLARLNDCSHLDALD